MKKELRGSYTVEAAFVMAAVLWAITVLIQSAYHIHDETTGAFALHEAVLQIAHRENMTEEEAVSEAEKRAGHPFSFNRFQFQITKESGLFSGGRVCGEGRGGRWKLEIEQELFDPENFLRMLTLAEWGK